MQNQRQANWRGQQRTATRIGIACRRFASVGACDSSDGELLNYSDTGAYVTSSRAFATGSVLAIRLIRFPENEFPPMSDSSPRTIFLAEVKWTQPIQEGPDCRYGIGLRYLE